MEFNWSEDELAFRREVRAFLRAELPSDWDQRNLDEEESFQFSRECAKKLAAKKWRVMHWPPEYGGLGYTHWRQLIFNEEVAYHRFPGAGDLGTSVVGPSIMIYGSEEQKRRFLNGIGSAELLFCQLFTEPGAGSDLAALQTRAVRDGDDYIINGQKIFTSGGHHADWGWMGVRTDPTAPKHRGISTLVVNMRTPGISIRPLINMTGVHAQNEIFFDDVRVPANSLVGVENRGWYQMATTLDFERSGVARYASAKRTLDDLVAYAKTTQRDGVALASQPSVRAKLSEMHIEIEVGRFIGYRTVSMQQKGQIPNKEASASKVFGAELAQRLANVGMNLLGLYGQLTRESRHTPIQGRLERLYKAAVFGTIGGGSSEVNRNIIAARGLGLPR
ncbi:MAG: acyl-CoA dehydrogenase family protein [Chloroflexi bacterium]|nr:acyl-CoA dehydrogenase family protein [Chloroflexota bacterium]